jgi:hypothetical protein
MATVTVFLFSEMDFEDNIIPVQYELSDSELGSLLHSIEKNVQLISFGNTFHHIEDIIKIHVQNVSH